MNSTVWSQEFGSYVSQTFLPEKERDFKIAKKVIKIDITKCMIRCSVFGYYSLWLGNKKLKELSFQNYLDYRNYVIETIEEVSI